MLKSIIAALIVASAAAAFVSKAYAGPTGSEPVLHGARVAEPRQRRQRQQLSDAIRQSWEAGDCGLPNFRRESEPTAKE